MQELLADEVFESWIFGVHSDCSITKHGLYSCCCYCYKSSGVLLERILERNYHSELYFLFVAWYAK